MEGTGERAHGNAKGDAAQTPRHSAGLTVHGFPGYATDQPIPTLVQIFNGEKPANTAPIRVV